MIRWRCSARPAAILSRFRPAVGGATAIEYALIAGMMAVAVSAGMLLVGAGVIDLPFQRIGAAISGGG